MLARWLLNGSSDYTAWDWRPEVLLVLGTFAILYTAGWWRLRRKGRTKLATNWRFVSYWAGILVVGLALMSPIDGLQEVLFSIHMVQHLLLMMLAPPLLWLGNPLPFGMWGLPPALRYYAGRLLTRRATFRQWLRSGTTLPITWFVFVAILWGWHDPSAYNAALKLEWVHDLEHISFFLGGMLFWWHVTDSAPYINGHRSYIARLALVILTLFQNFGPALAISMANEPIYSHYTTVSHPWDISVMDDQRIAGTIMWIPNGMMYVVTAVILISRLVSQSQKKAAQHQKMMAHSSDGVAER